MSNEKWIAEDKWRVSQFNFEEEVTALNPYMPEKIRIRDATLAEGQHQPGVHFSLEGMMKIARGLYEAGITDLKQGLDDWNALEFITELKKELPDMHVGLCISVLELDKYLDSFDEWKRDVDRALEAGIDELLAPAHFSWSVPTSVSEGKLSHQQRLERYAEAVRYGRSNGVGFEVGTVDTSRSSWADLKEINDVAVEAGATRIGIYDSYGCITPDATRFLIQKCRKAWGNEIDIMMHSHNDYGLAEANTVAGVLGGATSVDLTVNGLGDRAGNAALEEVVLQLEAMYGVDTGVKLDKLIELSRTLEEVTGIKPHDFKPVGGKNVFTHESEAHAKVVLEMGVDKGYLELAEPYAPHVVGGKREVRFGGTSLSGDMISLRMNDIGLKFGSEEVAAVSAKIAEIFETTGDDISLDEFDEIAKDVCK